MRTVERRRFREDPFAYLDNLRRRTPAPVIPLPWGGWCVGDADLARVVLRDARFHDGTSGFFGGLLPNRQAQVDVGHAVREVLRAFIPTYEARLAEAVADLPAGSRWPEAGASLVHRCLADVLLHPDTPERVRVLVGRAVQGGVLVRPPHIRQRARAEVLRARLVAALTAEVTRRTPRSRPRDVLDAILAHRPAGVPDRDVAELYLVLFRSVVAPVGYSLAWSVLLACLHYPGGRWPWEADAVVREALRHRPMAWMIGRTVSRPTEIAGVALASGDLLSVSPYLLHHDERHWSDPHAFRPQRWSDHTRRGTYVPFGAGPFSCAGAAVAHTLTSHTLAALTRGAHLTVTGGGTSPVVSDSAVPRPFTLHRAPAPTDPGGR
jgi:cytochrome P450